MYGLASPTLELSLAFCEPNVVQRKPQEDMKGEYMSE